jgi:hypothetical protein
MIWFNCLCSGRRRGEERIRAVAGAVAAWGAEEEDERGEGVEVGFWRTEELEADAQQAGGSGGVATRFHGAKPHMKQCPKQNANINNSTKNQPILMKLISKDWES